MTAYEKLAGYVNLLNDTNMAMIQQASVISSVIAQSPEFHCDNAPELFIIA